jgi:hypothetical protein
MNAKSNCNVSHQGAYASRVLGSMKLPHAAIGSVAALCAFFLYLSGVSSTVTYGGDCGELIAASYRLGIAHPTGYALYCC